MYQINKIHHADWMQNGLPDKSVKLLIADPPYFEVKGEFDFVWKSFDDYLADVDRWAREASRLLADNGTLFWYGDARKIAYSQVILDRYFTLLNNIVWEKNECQTLRNEIAAMRSFAPVTERILMYGRGEDKSALQMIADEPSFYMEIKTYLDQEHDKTGLSLKEITTKFGSTCSHYFGFSKRDKTQFAIPTREMYTKLQSTGHFNLPYETLVRDFDAKTQEYMGMGFEEKRRFFTLPYMITDVFHFSQESHLTQKYAHPTQKPETTDALP